VTGEGGMLKYVVKKRGTVERKETAEMPQREEGRGKDRKGQKRIPLTTWTGIKTLLITDVIKLINEQL